MLPIEFIKGAMQWIDEVGTVVFHEGLMSRIRGVKKAKDIKRVAPIAGREQVEVIVELPQGLIANPIRKLKIASPATAGEISNELAAKFNVNRDRWKLFGSLNKESIPKKLDTNTSVDTYRSDRNPNARLYFYPEIKIK